MKLLITGIAGFVGSTLARALLESTEGAEIIGMDNFVRPGSELNRPKLAELGIKVFHGDIRNSSDLDVLPDVDYVIDAAANPSVLAGIDGLTSSRQLVEHNLIGTVNMLEYCKARRAGFVLLSTSRVYAIRPLTEIDYEVQSDAFVPRSDQSFPTGLSPAGVGEQFSSGAPISLYGCTKLASEQLAQEYGYTFDFPVWINRCGVLAGAGQFGRPDQGIFSYWINSYLRKKPLRYIGFEGKGYQVRDCLHPRDLASLLRQQTAAASGNGQRVFNISGGTRNSMSLRQLSDWCGQRFPRHEVATDTTARPFDIPWMVLDHAQASDQLDWQPQTSMEEILGEIADHAEDNPDWLKISATH
jgi:CDP-paratose 2-epimerase